MSSLQMDYTRFDFGPSRQALRVVQVNPTPRQQRGEFNIIPAHYRRRAEEQLVPRHGA